MNESFDWGADLHVELDRGKPGKKLRIDRQVGTLLSCVKDGGSLSEGCRVANLSYTNAWARVRDLEQAIGKQLMKKSRGHASVITPEGAAIAEAYQEIQEMAAEEVRVRLAPLLT